MTPNVARTELPLGVDVIRRVAAPDAPWPAALVRTEDGSAAWLVDAGLLEDWAGWDAAADGHVLGALDVVRRVDGHDALVPLCAERVQTLLDRRGDTLPLAPGETVTVAVSVLRGLAEIAGRSDDSYGTWWITDEGRPVFVDAAGDPAAAVATAAILDALAATAPLPLADELRACAAAALDARAVRHEIVDLENRLFDVAAPEPIVTAPLGPARHRAATAQDATAPDDGDRSPDRSWWATVLASVDLDLADAFSQATTGLWRRLRRPARHRRRGAWLVAGSVGAGIVAVGLLWPAPDGPALAEPPSAVMPASTAGAAAADASPSPTAPPSESAAGPESAGPESAGPTGSAGPTQDLTAVAQELLDARQACSPTPDPQCLQGIVEDAARSIPSGAVDAARAERTVTLLDDFGGMAVLRVESTTEPAQLLSIVEMDGRWLLRDVHAVVQQP